MKVKLAGLKLANDLKRAFAETMVEIASSIPYAPTQDFIESVKDAIPHLAEVAQNFIDAVSDENLISAFNGLGTFYSACLYEYKLRLAHNQGAAL